MLSDVQKFYSGKTIFITGATGFLGKILLSKLLRSCQEIRCIYLLMRETAGKSALLRLKEIFDDPMFSPAKEQHPDYETKIKLIPGDCQAMQMGISDSDRAIIENEVDIIFHVAAAVNFTIPLRKSTRANVGSLDALLDIAKNMKILKAFVFVSTAYSFSTKSKCIEEKFYDPPIKPGSLLSLVDLLDEEALNEITRKLTNSYQNNYIFTKLVAEDLCRQKGSALPLCIFRPALIIPCYEEPLPGWINNTYGCTGVILSHALGILRVAPVDKNCLACIVPGDFCVNALILSAYHTGLSWADKAAKLDPPIINYSSCHTKFNHTWGNFVSKCGPALEQYPFYNVVSLPFLKLIKNNFIYRLSLILLHLIPAFVIDLVLAFAGKTPRLRKTYRRIHKFLDQLRYFSTHEWIVITDNIDNICAALSNEDKELFYCDLNRLNTVKYFENMIRGIRLYLAKDTEDTVPKALKKHKRFKIVYYSVVAIIVLVFLYILTNCLLPSPC